MRLTQARAWRKLREWAVRYAPAEAAGTVAALTGFWLGHHMSDSLAIAAICGTIGENIGYYGVAAGREVLAYWRKHHGHTALRRLWLTAVRSLRNILLEFGPAELVDSFAVRPSLFYLLPTMLPGRTALALVSAKILADIVFYGLAIISYELRKKYTKQAVPSIAKLEE